MDLGVVTSQLDGYGGAEIYLLECIRRWQREIDVTVYAQTVNRPLLREFGIGERVKLVKLPRSTVRGRYAFFHETVVQPRIWEQQIPRHQVYLLWQFPTQMIQRRPSVWFASEPPRVLYDLRHHATVEQDEALVHLYPKLSYDRLRVSDWQVLLHMIEKIDATSRFDRLATHCHGTARYLESVYGREADRVIYPGIDVKHPYSSPPSFDKLIFVGRLWRHKRVHLLLQALALSDPCIELIVAGEGPDLPELRSQARGLGIEKRVRFAGSASVEQRDRLYQEACCCVYTPVREPFGMVPLEAAAAGRPIVATEGGGYAEILKEDAAIFVPAAAPEVADAIHAILSNPQKAMEMGRAAQKAVEPHTWDRSAAELLELFRETAGPRPRRSARSSEARRRTELGAHYYPWYRAGPEPSHWNENDEFAGVTDWPVGGPYSSGDRSLLERHVDQVVDAGLDFLVVNWHVESGGPSRDEVAATETLFEVVEERSAPLQLGILLVAGTDASQYIVDSIQRVRDDFMPREPYHLVLGLPLIWYFLNDPLMGFLFQEYRELERLSDGLHSIATGGIAYSKFLAGHLRKFFSGWCLYSPLEIASEQRREHIWKESYRDLWEEDAAIRPFSISPGFEDSHLTGRDRASRPHRVTARRGVATYERMQQIALELDPPPDLVVVTSFNEFHENTHIEPSVNQGDAHLHSTRAFKERLRRAGSIG
jgi:glycosyltransferase involved in cell wall biosynthesis